MTPYERLVRKYGQEDIDKAKEIAPNCPSFCLVVVDEGSERVFYRDLHSKKIPTKFTTEQSDIAHRGLHHIALDPVNTRGKFRVYSVKVK